MDFKQSVITCLKNKYADFNGRAGRPEFWWFALFCLVLGLVVQMILGDIIGMLVNLALLLPSLAVGIRRLHDTDKSGWWLLLVFIPIVGIIVLIVFWVQDSQADSNAFGPSPKEGAAAVAA